ncbi:aspartate/glutamate racemase family protein [Peteryoungia ipomoeae]|uniref:Aspartate/glutamate racemase family protein n=1 Tax=Peteryoungia ipomoeae TaxID=1210932 RepID=A0A4S8PAF2_9HYPH|nr:aspartate/glutamate racemase family protein [Peteryoungia ipomoeae]THV24899.1 aspartate/glutamate racemase family protein [Peteryoungia ipomoeae]
MIGLIGGMSFESTAVYYRLINEAARQKLGGLSSAEVAIRSVNFADIVKLQQQGRWEEAAQMLARAGKGLQNAGADCALICTNTMHLVADAVASGIDIPLINIIDETALRLKEDGRERPLLLATRYTMEHGFYAERMRTHGIYVIVPDEAGRTAAHDIIFQELCMGEVKPTSRDRLLALIEEAKAQGADSVILGCTEICLLLDPNALPLPGYDSTAIHVDAAIRFALEASQAMDAA